MKSTAEIVRDLAILYGIKILDKPTGHIVVDANGLESPLRAENFNQAFDLLLEEVSTPDFIDIDACQSIQNQHSSLVVSNVDRAVFNTPKKIEQPGNTQYSMAA